jgi:hypothetical protein
MFPLTFVVEIPRERKNNGAQGTAHRHASSIAEERSGKMVPVCAENSDSAIFVIKATENTSRCDGAEALNRSMDGGVLVQSAMSPRFIIIGGKLAKDPVQMGLTEHDQVVERYSRL